MWKPLAFERPEYIQARNTGPVFRYQFILSKEKIEHREEFVEDNIAEFNL